MGGLLNLSPGPGETRSSTFLTPFLRRLPVSTMTSDSTFLDTNLPLKSGMPFKVADLSSETEHSAARRSTSPSTRCPVSWRSAASTPGKPLHGARITGSPAHDDPDRRAHRDAGRARAPRCAGSRATSSRRRITPRRPSRSARTEPSRRPRAFRCSPGRARRWRSTGGAPTRHSTGRRRGPDLIVDDGGDATLLIHKGLEFEKAGGSVPVPRPRHRGVQVRSRAPRRDQDEKPDYWTSRRRGMRGVSEETTTGVHRL